MSERRRDLRNTPLARCFLCPPCTVGFAGTYAPRYFFLKLTSRSSTTVCPLTPPGPTYAASSNTESKGALERRRASKSKLAAAESVGREKT